MKLSYYSNIILLRCTYVIRSYVTHLGVVLHGTDQSGFGYNLFIAFLLLAMSISEEESGVGTYVRTSFPLGILDLLHPFWNQILKLIWIVTYWFTVSALGSVVHNIIIKIFDKTLFI